MYRIVCKTNGKTYPLMDSRDEAYSLHNVKLTKELNKTSSLVFYMNFTHPNYGCIKKFASIISVYHVRKDGTEKWLYSGRSLTDEEDFDRTGKIECEGILAFLLDSIVRDYTFKGSPADYVSYLIGQHNAHVGTEKQFQLGNIDLDGIDNNDSIVRESTQKPDTLSEINSKVVELLGCYMSARVEDGVYYFDCTKTVYVTNSQEIRFGVNLLNMNKKTSALALRTVMIGIGAADSNGNKIIVEVEDAEAVSEYGRIEGKVEFSDVTLEENLLTKTTEYLQKCIGYNQSIEASAIDLNLVDEDIPEINLGYINVVSAPHGISEQMLISKMELDLSSPENSKYTLGISKNVYTDISDIRGKDYDEVIDGIIKSVDEVSSNVGAANTMLESLF